MSETTRTTRLRSNLRTNFLSFANLKREAKSTWKEIYEHYTEFERFKPYSISQMVFVIKGMNENRV